MAKTDVVLILLVVILALVATAQALTPNGATTNVVRTETANASTPSQHEAQAGNVTELNIFAYSTTQSWQGYFGNVSGTIQLADSSGDALYNWSLANPQGEIYASTNASITWTNIQCFNFTARGNQTNSSSGETAGAVNLYGTNLTTLENSFNIASADVDGVNETFNLQHGGAGQHDQFFTANRQFSEGECISTRVFGSSGAGVSNQFEEVLLYEPTTASVIFTALLENNVAGYDNKPYDFEMLVLEDGHDTNTATTTYYFYVELE